MEYLFVGSRSLRLAFGRTLRLGPVARMAAAVSRRARDEYMVDANRAVNEMLTSYTRDGWELVAVSPVTVLGVRIGFDWYFRRETPTAQ